MPRLNCTFQGFIDIIVEHGFELHRHDATSHRRYRGIVDGEVKLVDVAPHGSMTDQIGKDLLCNMIRQCGLSKKLFRK